MASEKLSGLYAAFVLACALLCMMLCSCMCLPFLAEVKRSNDLSLVVFGPCVTHVIVLVCCTRYSLQIDFLEAVFGCQKDIKIDKLVQCSSCDGSGAKAGTSPTSCSQCGGTGQLVQAVRTPLGAFQQVSQQQYMSGREWREGGLCEERKTGSARCGFTFCA